MPTNSNCGLCGGYRLSRRTSIADFFGGIAHLAACSSCGLVQVEDRPGNDVLEEYYSRYCYENESAWSLTEATWQSLRGVAQALDVYRQTNRCLDVGCGSGCALRVMAEAGWTAEGTELSTVAARRLESEGFRIHVGAIEDVQLPPEQYDAVILSEVIEHLRDPKSALARVRKTLRPGGAIYVTTPNFGALSRRLLGARWRIIAVPEHLFYFTTGSLAGLLRSVDLAPRRIFTEGVNPYEIWVCLRRGRSDATLDDAREVGESLRDASTRRPALRILKASVNRALRLLRLGDTLKAIAERPSVVR